MNMYTALLVAIASMQWYLSQISTQNLVCNVFDSEITNHAVVHDEDTLATRMSTCNPPFLVMGLYDPNIPQSPNTAIFADPLVKAEIMSDGFQGKDKEYGDMDNDGLIDILYTKNGNELWYIPNTGTLTVPDYQVINAVQTPFINVFSFRLVDWSNDGVLDLLLLEDQGIAQINLYNDIHAQIGSPASIGLLDQTQFPLRYDQLIEAGDIDGDGDMDVLVSGQDPGLMGTAFLEQVPGPPPFFFPSLQLGAGQTLPLSPMIPDLGGSRHAPELYNADCDNDIDLFISEPDWGGGGGRVEYFENTGQNSPFIFFTHATNNPYGLNDIVLPNTELLCNSVIMRFADFFGDGCAEGISYDPCSSANPDGNILFYKSVCACVAAWAYTNFSQCGYYGFNNFSSGPAPLTYVWYFDDPGSGSDNFSFLQSTAHQFSTCGVFNVCMSVNGPGCGNTFCQAIQVSDPVPPVALCKSNVVIALDANCIAVLQPSDIDNGSFDNCFVQSINVSQTMFNACGFYPVTFTVADWCGNTGTCNTVVQVVDIISPTILCPADIYLTTSNSNCSMVVNGLQVITSDNCGISSISYTVTGDTQHSGVGDASGLSFNQGVSVVTYTATDNCGNTASCSSVVVIECMCHCMNNMVLNPGFNLGSITGNLNQNGYTNNWFTGGVRDPGISIVTGCCDPYAFYLTDIFSGSQESIYQPGLSFVAGHHYKISFCARPFCCGEKIQFGFTASNSPVSSVFNFSNCGNCEKIGISSVISNPVWNTYTLPFWTSVQNWNVLYITAIDPSINLGAQGWIDNVCVEEVFYFCCGDEQAFIENTDNATNTYPGSEAKEGVFEVGNLMECYTIDYINWGDGSIIDGPIFGNTTYRHTYAETGSYEVQYQVREFDPQDTSQLACFDHIFIDDIVILPDTCFCGDFSNLFFRSGDNAEVEVFCGSDPILIECPDLGKSILLTGLFYCNGNSCDDQIPISWILSGPGGTQTGTSLTDPFFNVQILPSYISQNGEYTLSLSGQCGNQSCQCRVKFIVDCPDLCPCNPADILAFANAVDMGFSQASQANACMACFSPLAISNCETVDWYVGAIAGTPLATTNGSQSFCYTFTDPGSYTMIMVVSRKKPDGSDCETFTFSRQVNIGCQNGPQCSDLRIVNPNFNDGSVPGGLNSGGSTLGWIGVAGNPVVMSGVQDSHDGWAVGLSGNHDYSDVLQSKESICLPPMGTVTLRFSITQTFPVRHGVVKVTLVNGSEFKVIGALQLSEMDSSNWWESEFPFDVTDWIGSELCDENEASVPVYIQLSVYNEFGDNQGGPLAFSEILIDNVCVDNMVSSSSPIPTHAIKLFPNPNGGEFVIELPQASLKKTTIQIIGLMGQVLIEKNVEVESVLYQMDASGLPQGIYFLQIVSNGLVLSVDKFVKL